MFLIFRTTPWVVLCMAAALLVATDLYFIQSKPCFSMNWFTFGEDGLRSWANSNFKTAQLDYDFLFPDWQTYNTKSTEPRLKHLLFLLAEYQTTELSSACQKVVSTNLLKYEDILIVEFFLLCKRIFPPCRTSVVILGQGRTTDSNSVYRRFLFIRIWAIFREASIKSIFVFFTTRFSNDESCRQWLSIDASKYVFGIFWCVECCESTRF